MGLGVTDRALRMWTAERRRATKRVWFGVKTLFRSEAVGKPKARDRAYDASASLVESVSSCSKLAVSPLLFGPPRQRPVDTLDTAT